MNTQSSQNRKTATTEGSNPEVLTNEKEIRKEYYDNGQLWFKESYKDGERDGLFETYYSNGQLESKGSYKDGKQDGLWEDYHWNGQLKSKWSHKDGERDGLRLIFDDNGQLESVELYKGGEWKGTKTKESSVIDFTYRSLEELEDQVVSLFPDEEDAEDNFHYNLLNAVIIRKVCEGWNKKELLDLVDSGGRGYEN